MKQRKAAHIIYAYNCRDTAGGICVCVCVYERVLIYIVLCSSVILSLHVCVYILTYMFVPLTCEKVCMYLPAQLCVHLCAYTEKECV